MHNRPALDKLCIEAQQLPPKTLIVSNHFSEYPTIQQEFQPLAMSSLELGQKGNVEIFMGGVLDNTIGFICSPQNGSPEISPDGYYI